jgi:hypothetical protein
MPSRKDKGDSGTEQPQGVSQYDKEHLADCRAPSISVYQLDSAAVAKQTAFCWHFLGAAAEKHENPK